MKRNFDKWLENFRSSIATYDYYTDFEKIYKNVDSLKIELNILNSLEPVHIKLLQFDNKYVIINT